MAIVLAPASRCDAARGRRPSRTGRGAARDRAQQGRTGRLHRLSTGARHRRLCRRRRRARVAAHRRHQHAAEDLLLPARGAADRGHRSPDPHAGAQSRDVAAGAAAGGGLCGRHRRACSTIRRSRRGWRRPPPNWRGRATAARNTSRERFAPASGWFRRARPAHEGSRHRRNGLHRLAPRAHAGAVRRFGGRAGPARAASIARRR